MSVDVAFPIVSAKDPNAGEVVGTWFVLGDEPGAVLAVIE